MCELTFSVCVCVCVRNIIIISSSISSSIIVISWLSSEWENCWTSWVYSERVSSRWWRRRLVSVVTLCLACCLCLCLCLSVSLSVRDEAVSLSCFCLSVCLYVSVVVGLDYCNNRTMWWWYHKWWEWLGKVCSTVWRVLSLNTGQRTFSPKHQ